MSKALLKEYEKQTDEDIVSKIIDPKTTNRRELQEVIYERYASKIYGKCLIILKEPELAKDLSHDTFIRLFTKISTFRGESPFGAWVSRVTYNSCLLYLRKKKLATHDVLEDDFLDLGEDEKNQKIVLEARFEELESAIKTLKEVQRAILMMKYFDGYAVKDIASQLEMSESAVKMQLKRSRERIGKLLTVNT